MAKAQRENEALDLLITHLKERRGETWRVESRPDEVNRSEASCDFILSESRSNQRVALEITAFEWPLDRPTIQAWVRFARDRVVEQCKNEVTGAFVLSVDLMEIRSRRLLAPKKRAGTIAKLVEWFRAEAPGMESGTAKTVSVVPGIAVSRNSREGSLVIAAPTLTSIDFGERLKDLQRVVHDNARKFANLKDIPRWLLIPFPGVSDVLAITGPVLELPSAVDGLYFVDYAEEPSDSPVKMLGRGRKYIVEYADIQYPADGTEFDKETGALRIRIPLKTS